MAVPPEHAGRPASRPFQTCQIALDNAAGAHAMTSCQRAGVQPPDGMAPPVEVLGAVWTTLAEVLGSAAAAVLIRRAVKRASPEHPALDDLSVDLHEFRYKLRMPETWYAAPDADARAAVCGLVDALRDIVERLSGTVLVRRLDRIGALDAYRARPES